MSPSLASEITTPGTTLTPRARTRLRSLLTFLRPVEIALAGGVAGLCAVGALTGHVAAASALTILAMTPAAIADIRCRRLPNGLVFAAAALFALGWAAAAASGPPTTTHGLVPNAVAGAVAMAGPLLALHLVDPESLGFGDVKAGMVLGAAVGSVAWEFALAALALAAGTAVAIGLLTREREVPFGPPLVLASAATTAAAPWLVGGTAS